MTVPGDRPVSGFFPMGFEGGTPSLRDPAWPRQPFRYRRSEGVPPSIQNAG